MVKTPEKPKKYEERLMSAFDYDDADLEANRRGRFSQGQRAGFVSERNKFAGMAGVFLLLIVVWLISAMRFSYLPFSSVLPYLVALLPIIVTLSLTYGLKAYRLWDDLREDQVLSAEGRVELSLKPRQNAVNYFMQVGNECFPIRQGTFLALKNGDPYRIYYTPRTRQILAVEWLRDGNDDFMDDAKDEDEPEALNTAFAPPDEKPKRLVQ